jgi:hypothetical protein
VTGGGTTALAEADEQEEELALSAPKGSPVSEARTSQSRPGGGDQARRSARGVRGGWKTG